MKKLTSGFHLIEILTTLAMISILTALCLPLYFQYMVEARRMEAASMLAKLSIAMEQFHIEHNTYKDATLSNLHFAEIIAKNNYRLAIKKASDHDYLLLAKPQGIQAKRDKQCGALILSANDKKEITGNGKVSECW